MKRIIDGFEFEIEGTITDNNAKEVDQILKNYDWWTIYISNMGQRREAENNNIKKGQRLRELGIVNFKRLNK